MRDFDSGAVAPIFAAMSVSRELRRRLKRPEPSFEPCLPRPAKEPPVGPGWIYEIKHDGFRIIARRDASSVRLITRNGYDFSERFPLIVAAIADLKVRSCVIDGEAIACNENGLSVFEMIRYRQHDHAVTLCAFDLLEIDGAELRREPIEVRKQTLKGLLRRAHPGIAFNRHFGRGRRHRLPAGLRTRLRGHRIKAARLALSVRPRRPLAQDQEPRCAGSETRGGGGLEPLRLCISRSKSWNRYRASAFHLTISSMTFSARSRSKFIMSL